MTTAEPPPLELPASLNYIAVFLTLSCNLNCSYCINDPGQAGHRHDLFLPHKTTLSPDEWARALARLPVRDDLPITLQGGEPLLYWGGAGIGLILERLPHAFDLLSNFAVKPQTFIASLCGQQKKLMRKAPYPSIRVSYHPEEMEKAWHGRGFEELVNRCLALADGGFRLSPNKSESDVGIYMVAHPNHSVSDEMRAIYSGRVPFETKEFLGMHQGRLYGSYRYPFSTHLIASETYPSTLSCQCRTSELLLDPLGFVWSCHFHLYESWTHGGPTEEFRQLTELGYRFSEHGERLFQNRTVTPIGHLLDDAFTLGELKRFRPCRHYGRCIGCDTKTKNNRFQSLDDRHEAHTSVEIRDIRFPPEVLARMSRDERQRIEESSC